VCGEKSVVDVGRRKDRTGDLMNHLMPGSSQVDKGHYFQKYNTLQRNTVKSLFDVSTFSH
jgi:hypothetical protein